MGFGPARPSYGLTAALRLVAGRPRGRMRGDFIALKRRFPPSCFS